VGRSNWCWHWLNFLSFLGRIDGIRTRGQGFLAGFQVGDNYQNRKVLMEQRQEDRDREQYGRDLKALMNDWNNTKGDRSEEEFANSNDFAALAKRHAGSKVFQKAMNQGNKDGKTTKLRDIVQGPNGKNVLIVDTYDKEGRLISKGRPVTRFRDSLETNPNDIVAQFGNKELYQGMLGALQQADDYVDRVGEADRADALIDSTAPQGLAAETPPVRPIDPGTPEEQAAAGVQDSGAVTSAVAPSDDVQGTPLEEPTLEEQEAEAVRELTEQKAMIDSQIQEMTNVFATEQGGMSIQQKAKARKELSELYTRSENMSGQIEELGGPSAAETAKEVGTAIRKAPGQLVDAAGDVVESVVEHPATKAVTNTVGAFWEGLTGSGEEEEAAPAAPEGTKKTEEFLAGADSQADAAVQGPFTFQDYLNGKAPLRPQTGAQKDKIAKVSQDTAAAVNANQSLTRKQLVAWRKANRAQIIHGDKTAAQGAKDYYALLERHKKKAGDYGMTYDKDTGVAVVWNRETGVVRAKQVAPGSGGSDKAARERSDKNYARMLKVADIEFGKRDDEGRSRADFASMMDKSNNTMQIVAQQAGYHNMMTDAYSNQQAAIADASRWYKWASKADARKQYSSLSPFLAAEVLGVESSDAEAMGELVNELTVGKGSELTERDWSRITAVTAAVKETGISGADLTAEVNRLWSEFNNKEQ